MEHEQPGIPQRPSTKSSFELAADRCMQFWAGPHGGTVWVLLALALAALHVAMYSHVGTKAPQVFCECHDANT